MREQRSSRVTVKIYRRIIIGMILVLLISPLILCIVQVRQIHKLKEEIVDLNQSVNKLASWNLVNSLDRINVNMEENLPILANFEQMKTGKIAYLTFDDGPSKNTEKILDILKEEKVKATFFVIGKEDKYSKSLYKRIVKDGQSIAIHTYTHQYNMIYSNFNEYLYDFNRMDDLIFQETGVRTKLYRFPGGSNTKIGPIDKKLCRNHLQENGYVYFDWNVSSGDAARPKASAAQILDNIKNYSNGKDRVIVLMHDAPEKAATVEALRDIIAYYRQEGYAFDKLNEGVEPIQLLKNE